MRPLAVVVVDVDAEHAFEVTAVEDQQPVETLGTYGPDEALRDRVCLRRSHWCPHDPGALATEDFVEGAAVLAVAVADQEPEALLGEVEAEVARLLGDPVTARILRAAGTRRNSRQLGPLRRGAGSSFAWASSRRMLVGDARKPSLASSPQIRRWPQLGFSRASRNTNARTSADSGGRPRRPEGCRHFRRASARCQRNSVRGVSTPNDDRGK